MGKSGNQRLERLDEGWPFFRLELIEGVPDLGYAGVAAMSTRLRSVGSEARRR